MARPDVGVMRELLARVKAATGPDRRLDYEIFAAFATLGEANPWDPASGHFYTASIDAAVALMERLLAGWEVHFYRDDNEYVAEMVWPEGVLTADAGYFGCDGRAATRALAIVAGVIEGVLIIAHQDADLIAAEDQPALNPPAREGEGDHA